VHFGLCVGLVSSLLGVAGGELIIPTLVFAFDACIKTAGMASLLISLPTVAVGVLRYGRLGSLAERADLAQMVDPMGLGSVAGAVVGGLLVGTVPAAALKLVLGVILIVSAVRIFRGSGPLPILSLPQALLPATLERFANRVVLCKSVGHGHLLEGPKDQGSCSGG
jgi:uncharacterized membrane protein YfcA